MQNKDAVKALKSLKRQLSKKKKITLSNIWESDSYSPKPYCTCKDSKGNAKYLYASNEELSYELTKKEIKLRAYPCPFEKGWHLTKD